jgi:bifunctional UDP-N-acetylglucosamine pyrophosphorylase/glucosamine-1-phosphate N-acetyltransferase
MVIVLAADAGTRMKSQSRPKVLHSFGGRSLLGHVLAATEALQPAATTVLVGPGVAEVRAHLSQLAEAVGGNGVAQPTLLAIEQAEPLGNPNAIQAALEHLRANPAAEAGRVLVVPGDTPLLRGDTLLELVAAHAASGAAATVLTNGGPEQQALAEGSVCVFDEPALQDALGRLPRGSEPAAQLREAIGLLLAQGHAVRAFSAPADETVGVSDQVELAQARRAYNDRLLTQHMLNGVTVVDPATTWVDVQVVIEADATIRPNTQLEGATRIAAGAIVGPDCTLTDTEVGAGSHLRQVVANRARIGAGVTVGPYAYLRPGTELADEVHVGTFVEIKASDVGVGSKVPHLTYVGDASIGRHSNIGASSVFVNYDGVAKHRSTIGSYARTGADNMFVAPVTVGDGAYTAAGSVIAEDVPPGALAVARARQRNIPDWVARSRPGSPADEAAQAAQAALGEQPEHPAPKMAEPPIESDPPNASAPPPRDGDS